MIDQHTTTINTQRDMIESLQLENLELKSQISAQDTKIQSLQEIVLELQRMFKQQFGMVSDNGANDNGTLAVSLPRAEL
jgi:predicted RNase H-like nuclease (RuvC/YqgF family)